MSITAAAHTQPKATYSNGNPNNSIYSTPFAPQLGQYFAPDGTADQHALHSYAATSPPS